MARGKYLSLEEARKMGALPLFLSALAGLGLMGWRRRTV